MTPWLLLLAQLATGSGKDHEFWIRGGTENMEKVFFFFETVSKTTHR